jgi:hypothetical protein
MAALQLMFLLPKNFQNTNSNTRVNETEWLNEPEADEQQPNEFGGINSVIIL